ncbi:hypothetical protein JKP88DRAFT_255476 [Tribonema minus]|uniref:Uncharacterized protein n=1 Tax=Tribonema minus TaxID=303371 RepID=A0A835Z136_9STRA|nr:hypothetical protein JKP88DRAFT_255476 [Tribonema minus]
MAASLPSRKCGSPATDVAPADQRAVHAASLRKNSQARNIAGHAVTAEGAPAMRLSATRWYGLCGCSLTSINALCSYYVLDHLINDFGLDGIVAGLLLLMSQTFSALSGPLASLVMADLQRPNVQRTLLDSSGAVVAVLLAALLVPAIPSPEQRLVVVAVLISAALLINICASAMLVNESRLQPAMSAGAPNQDVLRPEPMLAPAATADAVGTLPNGPLQISTPDLCPLQPFGIPAGEAMPTPSVLETQTQDGYNANPTPRASASAHPQSSTPSSTATSAVLVQTPGHALGVAVWGVGRSCTASLTPTDSASRALSRGLSQARSVMGLLDTSMLSPATSIGFSEAASVWETRREQPQGDSAWRQWVATTDKAVCLVPLHDASAVMAAATYAAAGDDNKAAKDEQPVTSAHRPPEPTAPTLPTTKQRLVNSLRLLRCTPVRWLLLSHFATWSAVIFTQSTLAAYVHDYLGYNSFGREHDQSGDAAVADSTDEDKGGMFAPASVAIVIFQLGMSAVQVAVTAVPKLLPPVRTLRCWLLLAALGAASFGIGFSKSQLPNGAVFVMAVMSGMGLGGIQSVHDIMVSEVAFQVWAGQQQPVGQRGSVMDWKNLKNVFNGCSLTDTEVRFIRTVESLLSHTVDWKPGIGLLKQGWLWHGHFRSPGGPHQHG